LKHVKFDTLLFDELAFAAISMPAVEAVVTHHSSNSYLAAAACDRYVIHHGSALDE